MRKLREWVDKNGNKVYLNSTTPATKTAAATPNGFMPVDYFKSRFEKIYNHITSIYDFCDIRECEISDLNILLTYGASNEEYDIRIDSDWGRYPIELFHVKTKPTKEKTTHCFFDSYEELLDKLLELGVIKDKKLCESINSSLAEEFKLYESLWR